MQTKILLSDAQIPTRWYNVIPDMPGQPTAVINPRTGQPAGPEDLAPIFPMALIEQEVSRERWIDIPEEVIKAYQLWRPSPLYRAHRLEAALKTPAKIYYKYEGVSPAGSHKPNTAIPQAWYNKQAGIRRLATETGAGQWGSSIALANSFFGLETTVYMVRVSCEQKPYRKNLMEVWGATVIPSPSRLTAVGRKILEETPEGRRQLQFAKGPIFANVILADEINRTPPKTQAALLEAMQEHQVTAAGVRYPLEEPFFVLATQNPIEMEGTYPLPEAQLDRFMFNIWIDYLPEDDEVAVVKQTTSRANEPIESLFSGEVVKKVPIADDLARYAVRLADASRPGRPGTPEFIDEWVTWGAGLRAAQYLVLGAKARALLHGRSHVTVEDVKALAHVTMRHRILVGYRAEAEGVTVEKVIDRLLETVAVPGA